MGRLKQLGLVLVAIGVGYALPRLHQEKLPASGEAPRTYRPASPHTAGPGASPQLRPAPAAREPSPEFRNLAEQESVFATLYLAFRMAAEADIQTLERWAGEASAHPDSLYHFNIADIFVEKMVALDPQLALTFAEERPTPELRAYFITSVLNSWVRRDEQAVFSYYSSITNLQLQQQVATSFLRNRQLSAAFHSAVADELGPRGEHLVRSIAQRNLSAEEAFQSAMQDTGQNSARDRYRAAQRWYREDPEAAMDAVLAMPESSRRSQLLRLMLSELAASDPQQALEMAQAYAADDQLVQRAVLDTFARQDPTAALPLVEEFTRRHHNAEVLSALMASWVREDPEAALAYAQTMPYGLQGQALWEMATNYMHDDPEAALRWVMSLDSGDNRVSLLALQGGLSAEAASVAETLLVEVTDPDDRRQLTTLLARHKAERNPQRALQWLEQYRGEDDFGEIYANTLHQWSNEDPRGAAAHIEQRWDEPEMRESFRNTAWSWGYRDAEAAIAWAASLPDSPARDSALSALVEATAIHDPARARQLYDRLPPGRERDQAGASLANQLADGDMRRTRELMYELGVSEDMLDSYMLIWER